MSSELHAILAGQRVFEGVDDAHIAEIAGCASRDVVEAGELIISQGQAADCFYVICEGKVMLELPTPGRGPIPIQTLGNGDVLGWSWLFAPYRWHFDARALENTQVIVLDAHCVRSKCESNHDLGYVMLKRFAEIMAQRLQASRVQLQDIYEAPA